MALEEGAKMGLVLEAELVGYLLYGHRRGDKKCFGALHECALDKRTGRNAECLFDGVGYEGSWSERGRAIQIVENMVNEKRIPPMIIVTPDCNVGVHEDRPSHHTLWKNVVNYPRLCRDHDIEKALVELIQLVDSTYPVSNQHYIAGFSDGARLAANTVNLLPGYFSAVGLFSPVVHKEQIPRDRTMVYIYTGKKDMFHNNAKRFKQRLDKQHIRHYYVATMGGHTWHNWRSYLSDFLDRISDFSTSNLRM